MSNCNSNNTPVIASFTTYNQGNGPVDEAKRRPMAPITNMD